MPDLDPTHYRLNDLKQRWGQDPSSRLFLQLADEHRKLGQHQEAVAVLEQGLEHRPNDLSALVALGRSRLELENLEEAIEPLETVVSRDPTHIVASKLLIEAHLQRGDAVKASERLQNYRLLNDRDPELGHLEYRLERLQAETEDEAPTVVGGELTGEIEPNAGDIEPLDAEADVPNADTPEESLAEVLPAPTPVAREEIALPVSEPDVRPDTEAPSAELFQLAEDSPPPDLEALWATLPEKPAVAAEPFQGLTTLAAARHWDLLSQEGIFASPETPADVDEAPAVVEEVASVEASVAVEEAAAVDEPVMALVDEVATPEIEAHEESSEPEPVSLSDEIPPEEAPSDEVLPDEVDTEPVSAEPEPVFTAESDPVPDAVASDAVDESIAAEAEPEVDVAIEATEPEESVGMPAAAIAGALGVAAVAGGLAAGAEAEGPAATEQSPTVETLGSDTLDEPVLDPPALDEPAEAALDESPEVLAAPNVESDTESATVTLGELYLKQGHREEAEKIFHQVLEQDPDNSLALESLARLSPRRSEPLTAADLLAVRSTNAKVPEGLTAKKVLILGNYIKHLRAAAPRLDSEGARSVEYVP